MKFTKMHGAGNDYVYVDCFAEPSPRDPSAVAAALSNRHRGIGADGLILIGPSQVADARMQMWNADGSPAEMCGNGIRCVAKYVYERGIARKERLSIETDRGVLDLRLQLEGEAVRAVRVDMGPPILEGARIPTRLAGDPPLRAPLEVQGRRFEVTCVSMGNPHCVVLVEDVHSFPVREVGPLVESHPAFPRRTNVGFVQVRSPGEIALRVWERGAGETQACGTGACAAVVAGALNGATGREVLCRLPGGELTVEWSAAGNVFLTGPAVEVFRGEWFPPAA